MGLELQLQGTRLEEMCYQDLISLHMHKTQAWYNQPRPLKKYKIREEIGEINQYIADKVINGEYWRNS